jgi:hypothetical protein
MAVLFQDIEARVTEDLQNKKFTRIAALTVFAIHKPRIFEKGLTANNTRIGEYKDGPYKELRAEKGRETGFVNLAFTEAMKRDYQPTSQGVVGYGFSRQIELDKANWNEERYKAVIFDLSDEEWQLFENTWTKLILGE